MRLLLPLCLAGVSVVAASGLPSIPTATSTRGGFNAAAAKVDPSPSISSGLSPPAITDPPAAGILLARQLSADTCGYWWDTTFGWDWWTCNDIGAVCTNSGSFRQCCDQIDCITSHFWTTCYDSAFCPTTTTIGPQTLCCSQANAQYCSSYLFSTTASSFTFFGCGPVIDIELQPLLTVTPPKTTSGTSTESSSSSSPSSPSLQGPVTSSSATGLASAGRAAIALTSIPYTPASTLLPTSSNSLNAVATGLTTAALVGAIVGAVVVISVIGIVAFLIIRSIRRRRRNALTPPVAQMVQQQNSPPPPPPQSQSHLSMYGAPSPQQSLGIYGALPQQQQQQQQHYPYPYPPVSPSVLNSTNSIPGSPAWTHNSAVAPPSEYGGGWPASPPPNHYQQGIAHGKTDYVPTPSPPLPTASPAPELDSTNSVGAWGGNNRAELG